jgi:hypothetical protein
MQALGKLCGKLNKDTQREMIEAWKELCGSNLFWSKCQTLAEGTGTVPDAAESVWAELDRFRRSLVPLTYLPGFPVVSECNRLAASLQAMVLGAVLIRLARVRSGKSSGKRFRRWIRRIDGAAFAENSLPPLAGADHSTLAGADQSTLAGADQSTTMADELALLEVILHGRTASSHRSAVWSVVRSLLGRTTAMRPVPVLLVSQSDDQGDVAWLSLSRVPGQGLLVPAPWMLRTLGPDWCDALQNLAKRDGVIPAGCDVLYDLPGLAPLDGTSAQAAFGVALGLFREGREQAPHCAVSAALTGTALTELAPVEGLVTSGRTLGPKLVAARAAGLRRVIVAPENSRQLKDIPRDGLEVQSAATLKEALDLATPDISKNEVMAQLRGLLEQHPADGLLREVLQLAETPEGRSLGRFWLYKKISSRVATDIWAAWDTANKRRVVLKCLKRQEASPKLRKRFTDEARTLAEHQRTNIVRYCGGPFSLPDDHSSGYSDYLAMEAVVPGSLGKLIRDVAAGRRRPFDREAEIKLIAEDLLDAVGYLHEKNLIHHDIKPSNVLIEEADGRVKRAVVADFEVQLERLAGMEIRTLAGADQSTREEEVDYTVKEHVFGTPPYKAPELRAVEASDPSPRSDIYAIGLVIGALLAGRECAVDEPTEAFIEGLPCAGQLKDVLLRATKPLPTERYASCADFWAELRECTFAWKSDLDNKVPISVREAVPVVSLGVALNALGGIIARFLNSFFYFDLIGTLFTALVLGPWWALLVGLWTNTLTALLLYPGVPVEEYAPWVLVQFVAAGVGSTLFACVPTAGAWLRGERKVPFPLPREPGSLGRALALVAFVAFYGLLIAAICTFVGTTVPGSQHGILHRVMDNQGSGFSDKLLLNSTNALIELIVALYLVGSTMTTLGNRLIVQRRPGKMLGTPLTWWLGLCCLAAGLVCWLGSSLYPPVTLPDSFPPRVAFVVLLLLALAGILLAFVLEPLVWRRLLPRYRDPYSVLRQPQPSRGRKFWRGLVIFLILLALVVRLRYADVAGIEVALAKNLYFAALVVILVLAGTTAWGGRVPADKVTG